MIGPKKYPWNLSINIPCETGEKRIEIPIFSPDQTSILWPPPWSWSIFLDNKNLDPKVGHNIFSCYEMLRLQLMPKYAEMKRADGFPGDFVLDRFLDGSYQLTPYSEISLISAFFIGLNFFSHNGKICKPNPLSPVEQDSVLVLRFDEDVPAGDGIFFQFNFEDQYIHVYAGGDSAHRLNNDHTVTELLGEFQVESDPYAPPAYRLISYLTRMEEPGHELITSCTNAPDKNIGVRYLPSLEEALCRQKSYGAWVDRKFNREKLSKIDFATSRLTTAVDLMATESQQGHKTTQEAVAKVDAKLDLTNPNSEAPRVRPSTDDRNDDCSWVRWNGKEYIFTSSQQKAVVKNLWDARGQTMHAEALKYAIGSDADRFDASALFRGHPAWGEMIEKAGRGMIRLKKA